MKSLKVSFAVNLALLALLILNSCAMRKNTDVSYPLLSIQYSSNPKTHSRAIAASEVELAVAASDGNVYFYPKTTKNIYSLFSDPKREYRDLLFTENKILILAVGDSSQVTSFQLQKSDKIYKTPFDGIFLDGIDNVGNTIFMMGDPDHKQFSLYKSNNWGESWEKIKNSPFAYEGEAGFAASGTNVKVLGANSFAFVSGGDSSRYFQSNDGGDTWFSKNMGFQSCSTCGAYSFTTLKNGTLVAVGGDYLKPEDGKDACRISTDGGKSWKSPKMGPFGYRSNIVEIDNVLYCCGTNGIDYSKNRGKTWKRFANGNYFTLCKFDNKLAASTIQGTIHLFKLK